MAKTKKDKIKMDLYPKEAALIRQIREKFQYGRIEILTRDGIPLRILKVILYDDLAPLDYDEL